ncbi:enoyl-CoA hydratase/isomerase family protein [Frankia gtarii]|uniref:enoyl-CoA hydratase/isomerase family protein n=1 Tax=Frankia gtarii TaxID=2950102 RepID=UPI0021BED0B0|nr:enoyl-CoA hydratase/isomerase family protein [Frankia gtarii]
MRTETGPKLRRDGDLLILDLGSDENFFDSDRVLRINAILDEVEQAPPPRALITTGSGRHWCDGTSLGWLFSISQVELDFFAAEVLRLYARFLLLPMVSVAAIQGHAFANGVLLALSHDYRVMQTGRGYMCLPNVDSGYFLTRGEVALLRAKASRAAALEMITTGRRYDAAAAATIGLIDIVTVDEPVLAAAAAFARPLSRKDGTVIAASKRLLYDDAVSALCGARAAFTIDR